MAIKAVTPTETTETPETSAAPVEAPNTLALDFTDDELRTLLAFAKRRGFTNATSYLKQLVDIDAHKHDDDLPFMEDTPDEWILADLREAFLELLSGEPGIPAEEALAQLRAEFPNE
ncbi:MAG: hypothetical protein SGI73_14115 [Chloroflexota bacterium]|nr:hypothetical protein [Chloroflexota bacterium]